MTDHLDRNLKFTDKEFNELCRTEDGDISDLSTAFVWLTDKQKQVVTEDDSSRIEYFEEDVRCLMAEARSEFGYE